MKKSTLPRGYIINNIKDTLDRAYVGLEFTTRQFINDGLKPEVRDRLFSEYGKKTATDKIGQTLSGLTRSGFGVVHLEMKKEGGSRWNYSPAKEAPRPAGSVIEESKIFTKVGYTSDGTPLWRDDETGSLGWFTWTVL